jgi:hypothetical protein
MEIGLLWNFFFSMLINKPISHKNQGKCSQKSHGYVLKSQIEYLEENLIIRVESLKLELEQMGQKLVARVEAFRVNRKHFLSNVKCELEKIINKNENNKQANELNSVDALNRFEILLPNLARLKNACNKCCSDDDDELHLREKNFEQNLHARRLNSCDRVHFNHVLAKSSRVASKTILGYLTGLTSLHTAALTNEPKVEIIFLGKRPCKFSPG